LPAVVYMSLSAVTLLLYLPLSRPPVVGIH
jgi:hypothetical protein